jgi:uncharacterized protein (TIGR02466 family)
MAVRTLFPTHFYEGRIDHAVLLDGLEEAVRDLAREDRAGVRWSREHGYRGYTSYASLNDLPDRDPRFADLVRLLNRHVALFVREADLQAGRLRLDSLWVNLMKPGGTHSGHIHPHSAVSGTMYVTVPQGSGALKLEDPRLPMMMAAPLREGTFHYAEPEPGTVFLWESWLRHEVMPHTGKGERISVSFNYR